MTYFEQSNRIVIQMLEVLSHAKFLEWPYESKGDGKQSHPERRYRRELRTGRRNHIRKFMTLRVVRASDGRGRATHWSNTMVDLIKCYGCGALVKDIPGEPHKYIGASAGCWEIYGEILAKEYGEYGYPETVHRLTVDTYAIQHPGKPSRQSIQSVNTHLVSLYLVLEKGFEGIQATRGIGKVLEYSNEFTWLEPPIPNGQMTVLDVIKASDFSEHQNLVEKWARDVWNAWSVHHYLVRNFVSKCNL